MSRLLDWIVILVLVVAVFTLAWITACRYEKLKKGGKNVR